MKVLLSAFQCSPGVGSEPGTGWHWATSLADLGHNVTVLTGSMQREAILAAGIDSIEFRFIDIPGSPFRRLSPGLGLYHSYLRWQDEALKEAQASAQQYEMVHHVTWGGLHLGSMLWRLPVPMLYGPIGGGQTAPANYWRYFGRSWPAEVARTASTGPLLKLNSRCRDTVRNAAVTLVCNSATEDACRRLGAADIRFMLADGLPAQSLGSARRQPASPPVVFWVGRMLARKAPVLAVEAFAELLRHMPARLVMAGDGPLLSQVRATVERLRLTEHVELVGHVTLDEVRHLYDSASALLFTSLRESFGAPFLEALGRGLPAVALDHHGIADAEVGPAAIKVALPPRSQDLPKLLGEALRDVLSDGQWDVRSAAAVQFASVWTWPAKAATAVIMYEEILKRNTLLRFA